MLINGVAIWRMQTNQYHYCDYYNTVLLVGVRTGSDAAMNAVTVDSATVLKKPAKGILSGTELFSIGIEPYQTQSVNSVHSLLACWLKGRIFPSIWKESIMFCIHHGLAMASVPEEKNMRANSAVRDCSRSVSSLLTMACPEPA